MALSELETATPTAARRVAVRRLAGLILFVVGVVAVYSLAGDYLSLDSLKANQQRLREYVDAHYLSAALTFMVAYTAITFFSIPGIITLLFAGGLMFSPLPATAMIIVSATTGATMMFFLVRHGLTDVVRARTGAWAARLEAGFHRNAWSYMIMLRMIPLVPYFVVNVVPALLRVRPRVFVLGTFFGAMPGTFVYTTLGAGLGDALASGAISDPAQALTQPKVMFGLCGLALLALVPVAYNRFFATP